MPTKGQRHARIIQIVRDFSVTSQHELQDRLAKAGMQVTQGTLSRDLQELGVLKGAGGYVLPETPYAGYNDGSIAAATGTRKGSSRYLVRLERALRTEVRSIDRGGNLIVIRTDPGHANALAVELDRAHLPAVIGTVAGDDTVLLVLSRDSAATNLMRRLRSIVMKD